MIYKICNRESWTAAVRAGRFCGAEIDLQDGFIHFSAAHQVRETAAKHFAGQHDLLLVAVDEKQLGDLLKWEASRGGDRFPHLYGELAAEDVAHVCELPLDEFGIHQFPDLPDGYPFAV